MVSEFRVVRGQLCAPIARDHMPELSQIDPAEIPTNDLLLVAVVALSSSMSPSSNLLAIVASLVDTISPSFVAELPHPASRIIDSLRTLLSLKKRETHNRYTSRRVLCGKL